MREVRPAGEGVHFAPDFCTTTPNKINAPAVGAQFLIYAPARQSRGNPNAFVWGG
jgi:hypothetical protein